MIKISLVGDIGSGKTYISRLFNAPYFCADLEVKKIYRNNRKCFLALKKIFPKFIKTFPIKKKELSNIIRNNLSNLKKISLIVHPIVRKKLNLFLKKNKKKQMVILDIPLYLENKMNKKNDIIIFIKTRKKDVDKKLKKRQNYSSSMINILRKNQLPLKKKQTRSNHILTNNFNSLIVKKKVKILKDKILNDRSSS
tara:strand:+ start:667 stop:1254 length:588 start_codon:yes stop_codon:yes gene_type:complete